MVRLYVPDAQSSATESLVSYIKHSPKINVVYKPEFAHTEQGLRINYDAILYMDGQNTNEHLTAGMFGTPVFGIPRIKKHLQIAYLQSRGLNTPNSYYTSKLHSNNEFLSLLRNVQSDAKLILKIDEGARGLGQALLNKRQLVDLFESTRDEIREVTNKFKNKSVDEWSEQDIEVMEESGYSKSAKNAERKLSKQAEKLTGIQWNYHDYLVDNIVDRRDFVVQEYIQNRLEWRMLWFYNQKPIVVRRNIDKGNWQANACNNSKDSSAVVDAQDVLKYIDYDKLDAAMCALNAPFMSIDIYYDKDRKVWGVFEFQMEFGWTSTKDMPFESIHTNIENAVYDMVTNGLKNAGKHTTKQTSKKHI